MKDTKNHINAEINKIFDTLVECNNKTIALLNGIIDNNMRQVTEQLLKIINNHHDQQRKVIVMVEDFGPSRLKPQIVSNMSRTIAIIDRMNTIKKSYSNRKSAKSLIEIIDLNIPMLNENQDKLKELLEKAG